MSRRVTLLCLLPNILLAADSEHHTQTPRLKKNIDTVDAVMWPADYDVISLNTIPSVRHSLTGDKSGTYITDIGDNSLRRKEEEDFKVDPIGLRRYKRAIYKSNKDVPEVSIDNSAANITVSNSIPKDVTDIPVTATIPVAVISTVTAETRKLTNETKKENNENLSVNSARTSNITPLVKYTDAEADSNKRVDDVQELEKPSRRMQSESKPENSDIKNRILTYAKDAYEEINKKIEPVKPIKASYEKNRFFKLGYYVANMDTMEFNVNSMKKDLDDHKNEWDEKTVLDLYDKLMVFNKIVSQMMEEIIAISTNPNKEPAKTRTNPRQVF